MPRSRPRDRGKHLGKSEPAGMAGNPDMAYGLALAKTGVTTLIPDLQGFEERRDPSVESRIVV